MKIKNYIKIGAIFFIYFVLMSSISYGLNLSRVKTWSAGEVLTAADLNAEFNNILNHSITNSDIASNAAIVASKLDLTTGSAIGSTSPSTGAFTTLSSTGDTTLGNGAGDDATFNFPDGITYTPAATWTFSANQTVSGTWANLGTVTTVDINGGTIDGITDLAVVDGGTGASTAANARTNLGLVIGTDIQAYDAQLADIAGLTVTDSNFIVGNGSNWVAESGTTARTSLGLAIGTNVQAYDAQLDDLADGSLSGAGTCDTSALTGTTYLPDNTVDTTALKTATSEVSQAGSKAFVTITGGQYCHWPQMKMGDTNDRTYVAGLADGTLVGFTSYTTCAVMSTNSGSYSIFLNFLYHTTSGEDYWLWFLVDKASKEILSMSGASDHCAYGNSNDFEKQPHPFIGNDLTNKEIILIEKEQAKAIQQEAKDKGLSVLELVNNEYKIDLSQTYFYTPIHSGQFSPDKKPVLVEKIPDYITIRRLTYMSNEDKSAKENKRKQRQTELEAKELEKKNKYKSAENKLKTLGLTKDEIEALFNK